MKHPLLMAACSLALLTSPTLQAAEPTVLDKCVQAALAKYPA